MSFSIVHTADLHLDKNFSYLSDNKAYIRKKDLLNAFYQIIDFTLENKPDALLFCGDTFDKVLPRNPAKVHFTRKIREVNENGTEVFIIGGNHDVPKGSKEGSKPVDIMGAAGIAKVFSGHDFENINSFTLKKESELLNIHGLNFDPFLPSNSFITPKIQVKKGYNILMLHGALQGINCINNDFEDDNPIDASTISNSDLDYVALGHYHNFEKSEYNGTIACYSGSTEKMSFSEENDEKCFLHLEIDNSGVDVNKIKLKNRDMKTIYLDVNESISNIDNSITYKLNNIFDPELVLRLKLQGFCDLEKYKTLHKTKLYASNIDNFFWLNIMDELKLAENEIINLEKIEDNPINIYKTHMKNLINELDGDNKIKYEKALSLGLNMLNQSKEDF